MSDQWLKEYSSDYYVKKAHQQGYPSRAAYKLLAIHKKDHLIKPGMRVVDLGAAPGGWSQVAQELVGLKGKVIAVDLLSMSAIPGVTFVQGDFREREVLDRLFAELDGQQVDLLLSDMAPNLSGQKSIDQPRSLYLAELAWDCAQRVLRPGGHFLVKVFQGGGTEALTSSLKKNFTLLKYRKPDASRARSREFYLLGKGFLGYTH